MRVDKFLSLRHDVSRQAIHDLIDRRLVSYRGEPVRKNWAIERLDVEELVISWPDREETALRPEALPLTIIYEDADLAVIDKPAGMTSHPHGRVVSGTLVNALLHHLDHLSTVGPPERPGIVHRLDKETSGLMVIAKNETAHRHLAGQFEKRLVRKTYLAYVKGVIPWASQRVSVPISHSRREWGRMGIGYRGGRESVTGIRVTGRFPAATAVTVHPETGRTHQIRVVLDFLGFPIIGDKRYGTRHRLDGLITRHALHAGGLSFAHPRDGRSLTFERPPPADMANLRAALAGSASADLTENRR